MANNNPVSVVQNGVPLNTLSENSTQENSLVDHRQLVVEQGKSLYLIDEQRSPHQITEVVVQDHAHLTLLYHHNSAVPRSETAYRFELGYQAKLTFFMLLPLSEHCSFTADIFLQKPGAEADVYGLYVADGQQNVELCMQQHHQAPNTRSAVVVKGMVSGQAKTDFKGTIAVAVGAHNTHAVLYNKNLVLSETARAVSKPCLEVLADSVQCKHGTAIGYLDENHLVYLQSRGFSAHQAQKILGDAFAQEIVARIPDQLLKERWERGVRELF